MRIELKKCSEVPETDIYEAFKRGYSDYPVPMTLSLEEFLGRFFGPEGNSRESSFIAYDKEQPIGLVFGGMRTYDGRKTMRCGTLCAAPEYRGKGIASQLMELHMEFARKEGCERLFLEVLKSNERAIRFYQRYGYEESTSLKYFSMMKETMKERQKNYGSVDDGVALAETSFEKICEFRNSLSDIHINWQSELESFWNGDRHLFLLALIDKKELGYIVMSPTGKIEQIYVTPENRNQGIGTKLIGAAADRQNVEKIMVCFPENDNLESYFNHMAFTKDAVEQYEMVLKL